MTIHAVFLWHIYIYYGVAIYWTFGYLIIFIDDDDPDMK